MRALDYPGFPADQPGVVAADGEWIVLGGAPVPETLVRGRTCVLAVGSNGSPPVLFAKLRAGGVDAGVALLPYDVGGLAVAHSAHVSRGGYFAATPYAAPGGVVRVVASWFDTAQLAALDATELSYERQRLPASVTGAPASAEVYVSRWGVLAPGGVPLAATTQRRVHQVLAGDPELAALLPFDDAAATAAALAGDEALRVFVRTRLADLGWVASAGF
ncbi:MAG: hypothetical protein M3Q87_11530 [Actinomycetota bacterium]|nr:hypothetical protein [Actinomycetota bacterium]